MSDDIVERLRDEVRRGRVPLWKDRLEAADEIERLRGNRDAAMVVYEVRRQPDPTEGRAGLVADPLLYESEQDAWDQVNHLPGVQGRHPSKGNVYPQRNPDCPQRLREATNWQEFAAAEGRGFGDYVVLPRHVEPAVPSVRSDEGTGQ